MSGPEMPKDTRQLHTPDSARSQFPHRMAFRPPRGYIEEVHPNLFIGDPGDPPLIAGRSDWAVIHPEIRVWKRYLDEYGVDLQDALLTRDGRHLYLAFEDPGRSDRVNTRCIPPAVEFTHRHLSRGRKVLVHCIAGISRSPVIAMLYLLMYTDALPRTNIFDAMFAFSELYPLYNPNDGLLEYTARFFEGVKEPVVSR